MFFFLWLRVSIFSGVQTFQEPHKTKHHTSAEALQIVQGSVTESTLLQAQSICKVKVNLKGISDHVTAIALGVVARSWDKLRKWSLPYKQG